MQSIGYPLTKYFHLLFQNFFNDASIFLYEATGQRASLDEVVIRLPSDWSGCGAMNLSRIFPDDSADVIVRSNGSGASVWQPEGCGKTGKSVFVEQEVLDSARNLVLKESSQFFSITSQV